MAEEEDFSSLPLTDRFSHKVSLSLFCSRFPMFRVRGVVIIFLNTDVFMFFGLELESPQEWI